MFEKIGRSLADTGLYDVHVIGFPTRKSPVYPDIVFHPSRHFERLSVTRSFRPLAILLKILSIRPEILIITTHELLMAAALTKLFTGVKVIYDIRENYYRNIRFLPSFPRIIRLPLALFVRLKEKLLYPVVNLYVLSDRGYQTELDFIRKKFVVVENKVSRKVFIEEKSKQKPERLSLIFSGTLAESTGLFTAIELASKLHEIDSRIGLTLVGYCPMRRVLEKLQDTIRDKPFVQLIGGDQLVPHQEIVTAIKEADFGIVAYPSNVSTMNTIPTKLYEYLAARVPILMTANTSWAGLCEDYSAAIVIPEEKFDAAALLHTMKITTFYTTLPGNEIFWETEAQNLLRTISSL